MIRVLLVEDESCAAQSLAEPLRAGGMEIVSCASGADAFDAPDCDVVLADLQVPGPSSARLIDRLRKRDPAPPVLILAGHSTVDDAVDAMRAGARDFMTKPIEPEAIVERVRNAVELAPASCTCGANGSDDDLNLRRRLADFERRLFRDALRRARGKKSAAARLLGIDPSNWAYHAKRLQLQ